MGAVQATWIESGQLFLWASTGSADDAVKEELPEFLPHVGKLDSHTLVVAGPPLRRKKVRGYKVDLADVVSILPSLRVDPGLSDSMRVWSMAARLGLELASRHAVIPSVSFGDAKWRALLSKKEDQERFQELADTLPTASRLEPTRSRGNLRLHASEVVVRSFLDHLVDALFRQNVYPGPTRGWALEFADALRGERSTFNPTDARYQGVPSKLQSWSDVSSGLGLRLGMELKLPEGKGRHFELCLFAHPPEATDVRLPMKKVWQAGPQIHIGGRRYLHPAYRALQGLARAQRIFSPLREALRGGVPRNLKWGPQQTWDFLSNGASALEDAGFEIVLPEAFAEAGVRRIRARMCIEATGDGDYINLSEMLRYRWEVVLGDLVLSGEDFATILAAKQPIVQFRGDWVLLDPAELKRLPEGLPKEGVLSAGAALRAVLTGQHDGVPVVADDRLGMVLEALRNPPAVKEVDGLQATLRPYQQEGFEWLTCLGNLGLGACLADDMGLGKTIQVISHMLNRHRPGRSLPNLVVCPTSLMGNWTHELQRFAPELTVARYHGHNRDLAKVRRADVVITTYGLLARDIEKLEAESWEVIALDEAQAIKNPEAQRAKASYRLKARHRVAMSGTPVENRLEELWSLMHFLVPGLLSTRSVFHRTVAIPVERFGDEDVARRLRLGVSPFMMRRVKSDPNIISDLPDKVERKDYCTITGEQARLYREVSEEFLAKIGEYEAFERRGHVLAMLTALKQICNHPDQYLKEEGTLAARSGKLERFTEILQAVEQAGERAIVFTQYREMGNRLNRHIKEQLGFDAPFLHGGVSTTRRDEMVHAFQNDDEAPPVLLISLRAGGTGLNLTRATHVVHYDRWWNPAVEDQATDRAYRIGQHKNVQVHKLISQGTLEERIDKLLEDKRSLAESVVGSGERLVSELDDDALRALVALGDDVVLEGE